MVMRMSRLGPSRSRPWHSIASRSSWLRRSRMRAACCRQVSPGPGSSDLIRWFSAGFCPGSWWWTRIVVLGGADPVPRRTGPGRRSARPSRQTRRSLELLDRRLRRLSSARRGGGPTDRPAHPRRPLHGRSHPPGHGRPARSSDRSPRVCRGIDPTGGAVARRHPPARRTCCHEASRQAGGRSDTGDAPPAHPRSLLQRHDEGAADTGDRELRS